MASRTATPFITKTSHYFRLFTYLLFGALITGCGSQSDAPEKIDLSSNTVIELSDKNLREFTLTFAKDYSNTLNSLLKAFKAHKKKDDRFGFVQYRNFEWTPEYVEKKKRYEAIREHNKTYIETTSIAPLFDAFENLIYNGIGLKNSLLNEDDKLLKETLTSIEKDKKTVISVVKSMQ